MVGKILNSNNYKYRWDIQGLRAIAVLAVVIFHINPYLLPGGYIGVDIFFVISGYLIIGFIWRDLMNGNFNLIHFYTKRIRSLFPALFVMVLASCIAAYFLMRRYIYRHKYYFVQMQFFKGAFRYI